MSGERESVDPKAGGQTLAGTRRLGQHEVTQLLADNCGVWLIVTWRGNAPITRCKPLPS